MSDRLITPSDAEWPARLNDLAPGAPVDFLFLRGRPLAVDDRTIAIVGARRPTAAGIEAAEMFARGLVEAGFCIVSGLAVGIDGAAHRAALDAGGYTIGVLGCGLDIDYPERNSTLRRRIAELGTLVTEYPEGTPPNTYNFPRRNRIIAALAKGVLFVEGGQQSGGRITVRVALDLDREVFAVPGSIRNPMAAGPNELIRTSSAALVSEVKHVIDEIEPGLVWDASRAARAAGGRIALADDEARILRFLDDTPVSPDVICDRLEMKPGEVALALSRLEIRGLAARRSAGYEVTQSGARARMAPIGAH